jgi:hypothetical protein
VNRRWAGVLTAVALLGACGDDGEAGEGARAGAGADVGALAEVLALARTATARFADDVAAAEADGFVPITPMMAGMGHHWLDPEATGFDVERPHILVYVPTEAGWQLGALEWVFPEEPEQPPLPGATYGSFPAACHFADGTFVAAAAEDDCPAVSDGGSDLGFWHPDLVTLHVWLWWHNPDGLFAGMNPLVHPFDDVPAPAVEAVAAAGVAGAAVASPAAPCAAGGPC